jgi:putative ABC transport system substrate-binding protein
MPDNIRFLVNKQEQDLLGIHLNQDLLKIAEFSDVNKKGSNK